MSITRVKVLNKSHPKASAEQKHDGFENMMRKFRRACMDYGIVALYKEHQYYEKPSDKKRRIKRQKQREMQKQKFFKNN